MKLVTKTVAPIVTASLGMLALAGCSVAASATSDTQAGAAESVVQTVSQE